MVIVHHIKDHNYVSIQLLGEIKNVDQNQQEYELISMRAKEVNQNIV